MSQGNLQRRELILKVKKHMKTNKSRFWAAILKNIKKSKSQKIAINLSRITRYGKEDKIIVIPGKVLGSGKIDKKFKIAALTFSQEAKKKVEQKGGECLSLTNLIEGNVKGKDMMIIR